MEQHASKTIKGQQILIAKTTRESSTSSALSCCNLSNMTQTITCSTPKSITFLLPEILTAWPYMQLLHPDYGTVNVESTNWVNDYNFFSEKAQRSFDGFRLVSNTMTGHCIQRFIILLQVSWVVSFSRALPEVLDLFDFTS